MQPLVLYLNELSAPPAEIPPEECVKWKEWALTLFACLRQVSRHQPEMEVAFPRGSWHVLCGNKPLSVWVGECLGKTNFQWFLSKVRNVPPAENQDTDVYFDGQRAIGLTLSHLSESWAISFPIADSPWLSYSVTAIEYLLEGEVIAERTCTIKHLANVAHVHHWQHDLADWDKELANNNTIWTLAGYPIQMYPMDHGYPHVHLIDPQVLDLNGRPKTLAKYRIDRFERMEGPPSWDNRMGEWIERHREQLIRCWERCKRGGHPYCITEIRT